MRRVAFLVGLLALAGVAHADADAAELTTREPLRLPAGSGIDASWTAIFCDELQGGDTLRLVAPRGLVERHERRRIDTGPMSHYVDHATSTFQLTDVVMTIARADGWLGATPLAPGATLRFETRAPLTLAPRMPDAMGNWRGSDAEAETLPVFGHELPRHLDASAPIAGEVAGSIRIKLYGSTVTLEAAENATTIRTGETASAVGAVDAWVVIHLDAARGTLGLAQPCQVATASAVVHTDAPWSVPAARGEVVLGEQRRPVDDAAVHVEGPMRAVLRVVDDAPEAMVSVALARPALPSPAGVALPGASPWHQPWLVAVAAAVVGAVALHKRRPEQPEVTLEQCVDLSAAAVEAGRYANALEWTRRAQAFAPKSPRLKMDEAWYLWETGDVTAAIEACDAAVRFGADAEILFIGALLMVKADEPDRARSLLLAALRETPCLALETSDEPAFARLRAEPAVAKAVRDGLRRCE